MKLEDLAPKYQAQAKAQLFPFMEKVPVNEVKPVAFTDKKSKTEEDYERTILQGKRFKYEGITLKMANGHRYTPDFYLPSEVPGVAGELHEVKGSYRLHSHGRAKLAFDQARVEFPEFKFVWATKTKTGWEVR